MDMCCGKNDWVCVCVCISISFEREFFSTAGVVRCNKAWGYSFAVIMRWELGNVRNALPGNVVHLAWIHAWVCCFLSTLLYKV